MQEDCYFRQDKGNVNLERKAITARHYSLLAMIYFNVPTLNKVINR